MGVTISWAICPEHPPEAAFFFLGFADWGQLQREMCMQGLVYEASHLWEPLPDWDEFDVPDDPEGTPELRAWEQAVEPLLRREDADPPGLPWHKIDSPDGHVLSQAEIAAALAKASATPLTLADEGLLELWRDWLAFLRLAATNGGGASVTVGADTGSLTHPPDEWMKPA